MERINRTAIIIFRGEILSNTFPLTSKRLRFYASKPRWKSELSSHFFKAGRLYTVAIF